MAAPRTGLLAFGEHHSVEFIYLHGNVAAVAAAVHDARVRKDGDSVWGKASPMERQDRTSYNGTTVAVEVRRLESLR